MRDKSSRDDRVPLDGPAIRMLGMAIGLRQWQIAERVDSTPNRLSLAVARGHALPRSLAERIAAVLHVPLEAILLRTRPVSRIEQEQGSVTPAVAAVPPTAHAELVDIGTSRAPAPEVA